MSFERSLSISSDLSKDIGKETRSLALRAFRNIILSTPVDEGRARGNWQLSVATPISSQVEDFDRSGGATISKGASVVRAVFRVKYPTLWITNNLPYIQRLNEGHSAQAPVMFVETAIKRALR